ncbi:MAG TPA: hypothetical protein EYP60_04270 [bacterium (Candidatus Stahlbacteria)]|nr:hypothetical protein [Candidatus Stahlbacteria bacterium]
MIVEIGHWIWILPKSKISIPNNWPTKGGKWLIFDKRKNLEKLAHKIESYVESRQIHSAKYSLKEDSVMCVYCLDKDRAKVCKILSRFKTKEKIWKYNHQTVEDWSIGGRLWFKLVSGNVFDKKEAARQIQEILSKFKNKDERSNNVKKCKRNPR